MAENPKNVVRVLGKNGIKDADLNVYKKNSGINTFMKLMKLLPTHRKKFNNSLRSALTEPTIDPMLLLTQKPDPNIIAILSPNNTNEVKYYIQVKSRLISVQPDADFDFVLDLFYKVHKLFKLDFGADFAQLMIFLDCFVYGNSDESCTPSVSTKQIAPQLLAN